MSQKCRVLVVEDDDAAWFLLEMILKAAGFETERAKGGQSALELVRKGGFSAVLLDLMLPEMSGENFLAELNSDKKFKNFPILVNSASADAPAVKRQIKDCANLRIEILPRPADPADIQQGLRRILNLTEDSPRLNPAAKKKVLIVDDDSAVRAMYVPYFTAKGYDAIAASNGKEAIAFLKKDHIDMMILDLNMPEMTGEQVMQAMADNAEWKKIPIIIDSAVSAADKRLAQIKTNFSNHLRFEFFQRPTSLEELNEAIDRILIA